MAKINPEGAVSKGDVMRRLAELERRLAGLETARRLEAASIGAGGLRVFSGGSLRLEGGGDLTVADGGDIEITGGRLRALDSVSALVFEVATNPASIFMKQELISGVVEAIMDSPSGRDLAAAIFADRIHGDRIQTNESTSSATFTDLATVGPQVTVNITTTGLAVVIIGSTISPALSTNGGVVSFEVSGATSVSPTDSVGLTIFPGIQLSASKATFVENLNPGNNTFTMKYRRGGTSGSCGFFDRNLIVIGL